MAAFWVGEMKILKRIVFLSFLILSSEVFSNYDGYRDVFVGISSPPLIALSGRSIQFDLAVTRCSQGYTDVGGRSWGFLASSYYEFIDDSKLILYYGVTDELSENWYRFSGVGDLGCLLPTVDPPIVAPIYKGEYRYYVEFPVDKTARYDVYVAEYTLNESGEIVDRSTPAFIKTVPVFSSFDDNVDGSLKVNLVYADSSDLKFNLEAPVANHTISGLGVLRGWACWGSPRFIDSVAYQIDDGKVVDIPFGSGRRDTKSVCNGKTKNGFAEVINWNRYGNGEHSIRLFVNGEQVDQRNFFVYGVSTAYQTNLNGEYELLDFPEVGQTAVVRWSTTDQDFVLVDVK